MSEGLTSYPGDGGELANFLSELVSGGHYFILGLN